MRNATINDVAKLAGVSIKTVSRVVNEEPNVRESTRAKVKEAIAQLNYRPNQSARNLASHTAHLVCLVYDDPSAYEIPSASYVIRMQHGALLACKSRQYELLIYPCNYRSRSVGNALKELVHGARPAGIVLAAPLSNMPRIINAIDETGTPLVRLSPGTTRNGHFTVATNDRDISAELTRYLASLGHRRIAFIKGHRNHHAVQNRFLGYQDGLRQSGLKYSERLVVSGDNSFGSGEATAQKLLNRQRPPTAIFAANDDMAAGVMRQASRMGIDIPKQLSVTGCDDISLARQVYPELTTIRQPLTAMAERATTAIIDHLRGEPLSAGVEVIPAVLKFRGSTGPAPE